MQFNNSYLNPEEFNITNFNKTYDDLNLRYYSLMTDFIMLILGVYLLIGVTLLIVYFISYCFIGAVGRIKKLCDDMKERIDLFFHTEKDFITLEKYVRSLESRISKLEKNKTH